MWWQKIFNEAGLSKPEFTNRYTSEGGAGELNKPNTRLAPYYFNFGFIVSPNWHVEKMSQTYEKDIKNVDNVLDTWFKSQIVNTISYRRYNLSCGTLSVNYNFPLHLHDEFIRKRNPDSAGNNSPNDIKVFHYLGDGLFNKEDFLTRNHLLKALGRMKLTSSALVFRDKLKLLFERLENNGNLVRKEIHRRRYNLVKWGRPNLRNRFLYLLKIAGVYDWAKKMRQDYYRVRLQRKYSVTELQVIAKILDVYFWSVENFDLFGSSYFEDKIALKNYFKRNIYNLIELNILGNRITSKKERFEYYRLQDEINRLFGKKEVSDLDSANLQVDNGGAKLIFVCGGRRSGTTLLNAILVSDVTANSLGQEAQILTRITKVLEWYKKQNIRVNNEQLVIKNKECLYAMMREFAHSIVPRSNKPKTIILKNPEFSLVIGELYSVFPNAIFIATIRDPRDQIVSELEVMKKTSVELGVKYECPNSDIRRLAQSYLSYIENLIGFNKKHHNVLHFIKYEELVTQPNVQIKLLEEITKLSFGFCPESEWKNISYMANLQVGASRSQNYGRPITTTSVCKFNDVLSKKDISEIESICKKVMDEYSYDNTVH